MSRVRDLFERVNEDLVNNCTVDAAAARPLSPAGADVDLIVGVLPERSSKVVT